MPAKQPVDRLLKIAYSDTDYITESKGEQSDSSMWTHR